MSTILDYMARKKLPTKRCRVCNEEFAPKRQRQVLCGRQACTNEDHRRRGVSQWLRDGITKFQRHAPNQRYKNCPCGKRIEYTCGNKKYCDDCRDKTLKEQKRRRAVRRQVGGKVEELGSPHCPACGAQLDEKTAFGTDRVYGYTTVACGCGWESRLRGRNGKAVA